MATSNQLRSGPFFLLSLSLLIHACTQKPLTVARQATLSPADSAPVIDGVAATTVSDTGGVLTATVQPGGTQATVVTASASSAVKGAAVGFPPGALLIATDVSIQTGASLETAETRAGLGLSDSDSFAAAGPTVLVTSAAGVDAVLPFRIAIPLSSATLQLADAPAGFAVIYHAFLGGKMVVGIIPASQVKVVAGLVQFETKLFGAYQAFTATELLTVAKQAASTTPVTTVAGATVNAAASATTSVTASPKPGAFKVTAPAALGTLAMPDVTWSASADATDYDVVISAATGCAVAMQSKTGLKATSFTPSTLADGSYFVCVKAKNAAGELAAANDSYQFTVDSTAPGAFALSAPATLGNSPTPAVTWSAATDRNVVVYDLTIGTTSTCASPLQTYLAVTAATKTLTTLADGAYFACVTARDSAGNTVKATNNGYAFTVKATPPGAFTINAVPPALTTINFSWQAATTATTYDVAVTTDSMCSAAVHTQAGLQTTSVAYSGPALTQNQIYYLCITAHDAAGNIRPATNNGRAFFIGHMVVGQSSLSTNADALNHFGGGGFTYGSLIIAGTKLIATDPGRGRVLIWNSLPTTTQTPPDVVVGQANLSSATSATACRPASSTTLCFNVGLASDGTRLVVADAGNNRVLVWNTIPTASGQAADLVIGQTTMTGQASATTAATLAYPSGVAIVGTGGSAKLFVVDQSNNRVVVWSTFPTSNGQAADFAIGQADLVSGNFGHTGATLSGPNNVATDGTNLLIADGNNHRVLLYTALPTTSGAAANLVLGQADKTTTSAPGSAAATNILNPANVAIKSGKVYVADVDNNRVLIWNTVPSSDGQAADVVVGQTSMTATTGYVASATNLFGPMATASDGTKLYIYDNSNLRIVGFNTIPTSNGAAADLVLGQPNLTTSKSAVAAAATSMVPTGAASDGTRLLVTDQTNNRVLLYNTIPTAPGATPDVVLGQSSFTGSSLGTSATTLWSPSSAIFCNGKIVVADTNNARVLIWNTIPTTNGAAASLVLGQANFTTGTSGHSATTLYAPQSAACDSSRLYVADSFNNRVLIWNSFPSTTTQAADVVVGQANMTGNSTGSTSTTMNYPGGVASDGTRLFVADTENHRVLIYNPIPTANGAAASTALGQPDLTTHTAAGGSQGMNEPWSVTVSGSALAVADRTNNRVLRWSSIPTSSGTAATSVFGQSDLTTLISNGGLSLRATVLATPYSVFSSGGWLYISDTGNSRVVMTPWAP